MLKNIQIRKVPAAMHRKLKARAARAGRTLSDYVKEELALSLRTPTVREWLSRLSRQKPVLGLPPAADLIREDRESHE